MARLSYANPDAPDVRPLVERIVRERGSLLHLYQMLLHSPPLAEGWLAFLTAVRHHLSLSGALRELVIMRIAILNGAPYEADQHAPIALREGVSRAQLDALGDWHASEAFSGVERAVLALTDEMTRDVHVRDETFEALRPHFGEREIVELAATVAAYNMVSRFLAATGIHGDDARPAGPQR